GPEHRGRYHRHCKSSTINGTTRRRLGPHSGVRGNAGGSGGMPPPPRRTLLWNACWWHIIIQTDRTSEYEIQSVRMTLAIAFGQSQGLVYPHGRCCTFQTD